MSALEGAVTLVAVLGLLAVLSVREVLAAGALAPAHRRVLDRAALPLVVAFCLVAGRQFAGFF
jgi:hypothetical protein